jgi:very-short-patch-repair endonuclease
VECDGATYHSARAARDRDKYRQAVLEGLGWEIYRIWSTDWFENAEAETRKLMEHAQRLVGRKAS